MIASKQRGDVPDPLDERRGSRRANLRNHQFARFPIGGVDPDLDQFVMVEGLDDFLHDRRSDAVVADNDDWLEVVSQGFEMTLLRMSEDEHEGRPEHG